VVWTKAMSLYQQLKYSAGQLQKLARERESLWPPPITFSQMGKYEKPKGTSDKDDKKDAERYVKFEVPLNNADPASDKYERKVRIYDEGKAFDWCLFRESTDDLFDAFGCAGNETNQANKRHHLFIALFSGRAKETYMRNYNQFHTANNALPIDEQASDAEVLKLVVNDTAKSFFDSWDTSVQEQQQYMRQNLFIGESKPSVFIERLKRMNKMLQYFPRANVFDDDNILIEEEQLISIVHHASHGIMQLQIQRAGRTINEFKTLEDLKVFFSQQHDCDMLEKRILNNGDKNDKNKKQKKTKKTKEKRKRRCR
jgi:hypothetical protein